MGISVEAFLNEYGYLRFGEEFFEENLRYKGMVHKLREMLEAVKQTRIDASEQILTTLSCLASRRNAIVHMHPELSSFDESGVLRDTTARRIPRMDTEEAEAAIQDMEHFFHLFLRHDAEAAMMLGRT